MKKILIYTGVIILGFVIAVSLSKSEKNKKKALRALRIFEAFVEIQKLTTFEYQIDSKGYSLYGHYTFEVLSVSKGKTLKLTQWRNVAGLMGPEFEFVFFYEGNPSFEEVKIISYSEPWERWQQYRTVPLGEKVEGRVLATKEKNEFFEELTLHLTFIMEAYGDTNFSFEKIVPQVQPNPLLEELRWEDQVDWEPSGQ